jgi:hypothetical protein
MREGKAVKARNCSAGCVLGHERLPSEPHHLDWANAQKPTKVELADTLSHCGKPLRRNSFLCDSLL